MQRLVQLRRSIGLWAVAVGLAYSVVVLLAYPALTVDLDRWLLAPALGIALVGGAILGFRQRGTRTTIATACAAAGATLTVIACAAVLSLLAATLIFSGSP